MWPGIQFVNAWSRVLKIGRIKERFIRFRPEDTFNSAVTDRRYSHPTGFKPISPAVAPKAFGAGLNAATSLRPKTPSYCLRYEKASP